MLKELSRFAAELLFSGEELQDEQKEICSYGIELFLHTIASTIGLLLIGMLCRKVKLTCEIILVYYVQQTIGGGFHATSHIKCFLTMSIGLLVCFFLAELPVIIPIELCIGCLSGFVLLVNPVHLHPNKRFLMPKKQCLERRSIMASLFNMLLFFVSIVCESLNTLRRPLCLGLLVSALSRLSGKIFNR